jgi:UDP-glucose 4-epimerase
VPRATLRSYAAIRSVEAGCRFGLPPAGDRSPAWLDITRLREDTGFEPHYDTAAGVTDYIAWFRAGNLR